MMPNADYFFTESAVYAELGDGLLVEIKIVEMHLPLPDLGACGSSLIGVGRASSRDDVEWRDHCDVCSTMQCDVCDLRGGVRAFYARDGLQHLCPACTSKMLVERGAAS